MARIGQDLGRRGGRVNDCVLVEYSQARLEVRGRIGKFVAIRWR